ncbi:30S ribosomal protein S15 [Candidatus Bandiella euplotis]|uniref:Small ribosomal subunit protein uS15 n=1 Tax=Candidatus Bandiella euplotis TaxID=1664265 RepID=A0ABZ0ULH2_9RICK|nr:30S ribosomal protein S15 [Candidatus Bandiella woodruffii]WPX96998.1 30S ribosomal protein S15 [Candidatus Bandiella woodruffii]
MSITKELQNELITKFGRGDNDTGSSEVQCALFTHHIKNLTEHLKANKKDYQAKRGLLAFVVKRKRLLTYLKRTDHARYEKLIQELQLKGI